MKNYKLETFGGDSFRAVAEKAREIAKKKKVIVEFEFNGVTCLVSNKTVVEWLNRDYCNAHIMEWKTVGHDCPMAYDHDTEIELRTRQLKQATQQKEEDKKQAMANQKEADAIKEETKEVKFEVIAGKEKEYKKYVEDNSKDGYSKAVVDYSDSWAKLMQVEISKGKTIVECTDETQEGLGYMGITGFQFGCVMQALSSYWKHGEELRKWHNKAYGVSEDEKGVVNPAIMTIGK